MGITVVEIMQDAERIQERDERNNTNGYADTDISDDLTLAANKDPNKKLESEYDDWGA